jgi:protein-S-isoprenylcysteine O-methyltransferase Ste14
METLFRIILPVLIITFAAHRGYYVKNHSQPEAVTVKKRQGSLASKVSGLLGMIGFVSVIIFAVKPSWLAFASLSFSHWVRWAGVALALAGFALLQWAQVALGKSWSDTPRMMKEQMLITSGPYQSIRHPIYTAFILILSSPLLISANWLIGLTWMGMTITEVASRIGFEESLMLEYFGDQYQEYMNQTGRLLPRLIK